MRVFYINYGYLHNKIGYLLKEIGYLLKDKQQYKKQAEVRKKKVRKKKVQQDRRREMPSSECPPVSPMVPSRPIDVPARTFHAPAPSARIRHVWGAPHVLLAAQIDHPRNQHGAQQDRQREMPSSERPLCHAWYPVAPLTSQHLLFMLSCLTLR